MGRYLGRTQKLILSYRMHNFFSFLQFTLWTLHEPSLCSSRIVIPAMKENILVHINGQIFSKLVDRPYYNYYLICEPCPRERSS